MYCQDGVQAFFGTETQPNYGLYGHYDLQSDYVNDRPYYQMKTDDGTWAGIWWDKIDSWWIGPPSLKGQAQGWAYYTKDAFCPYQLNEWKWKVHGQGLNWIDAGSYLGITCKYCSNYTAPIHFTFHTCMLNSTYLNLNSHILTLAHVQTSINMFYVLCMYL